MNSRELDNEYTRVVHEPPPEIASPAKLIERVLAQLRKNLND